MNSKNYLSEKIFNAIKYSWILFIIYFLEEFFTNYFFPEDKSSVLAETLRQIENITYILFFSWYFVINKRIRSSIITIIILSCFFCFNTSIQESADYYLPVEKIIDSDTLKTSINYLLLLLSAILLGACYAREEQTKGFKSVCYFSILNLCLLLVYDKSQSIVDQLITIATFDSNNTELITYFIYFISKSIQAISFLVVLYFLIAIIVRKESIYAYTWDALRFASRYFKTSLFFSVSALIFSMLSLAEYFFSFLIRLMLNWSNFNHLVGIIIFAISCILLGRFIGLLLYQRAHDHKNYYGVIGGLLWLPFISIISYILFLFEKKLKLFRPKDKEKAQKIHLACAMILIIFFFKDGIINVKTTTLLIVLTLNGLLFLASFIRTNQWLYTLGISFVLYLIIYNDKVDYSEGLNLIKEYIATSVLLVPMIYSIYYIINKSMYLIEEED